MDRIMTLVRRFQFALYLLRSGQWTSALATLRAKLWSDASAYGMRRYLALPVAVPLAAISMTLQIATPADVAAIMNEVEAGITTEERNTRHCRAREMRSGVRTAFVGVAADGTPCYFQMAIHPEQNDLIHRLWGQTFPVLEPHQVLLEGAYTPSAFRGKRIMPHSMAMISERLASDTTTEAITFVGVENIASIKGCIRAGYEPYCLRIRHRRLFRERIEVMPLDRDAPLPGVNAPLTTPESSFTLTSQVAKV